MMFDDRFYTLEKIVQELYLIENHAKDGSALQGGCSCIEGKHLHGVEGYANEGVLFAMSKKEEDFYKNLAHFARDARHTIEDQEFIFPNINKFEVQTCEEAKILCKALGLKSPECKAAKKTCKVAVYPSYHDKRIKR